MENPGESIILDLDGAREKWTRNFVISDRVKFSCANGSD
jgi:hypothetical protein